MRSSRKKRDYVRKYTADSLTPHQQDFLIGHFQREWDDAARTLKRHERAEQIKTSAKDVGRILLQLALIGGVVTAALVAPKVFVLFANRSRRRYLPQDSFTQKLNQQSSKSYLTYTQVGGNEYRIALTPEGRKRALHLALEYFALKKADQWDGRWRIVTFDIPKKHSGLRDALRNKLTEIGMVRLQDSVFVYPYPCHEEIAFWAELYGITHAVHVAEANFLTDLDPDIYTRFSLPRRLGGKSHAKP